MIPALFFCIYIDTLLRFLYFVLLHTDVEELVPMEASRIRSSGVRKWKLPYHLRPISPSPSRNSSPVEIDLDY